MVRTETTRRISNTLFELKKIQWGEHVYFPKKDFENLMFQFATSKNALSPPKHRQIGFQIEKNNRQELDPD